MKTGCTVEMRRNARIRNWMREARKSSDFGASLPAESENFSWHDALDVAQYRMSRLLRMRVVDSDVDIDLPVFLICAMQLGESNVDEIDLKVFYYVQKMWFLGEYAGKRIHKNTTNL